MADLIVLDLGDAALDGWLQPLAGGGLWTAWPLAPGAKRAPRPAGPSPPRPSDADEPIYDGPALVDGALDRLRCWRTADGGQRLTYADGETFAVAADGAMVSRLAQPGSSATSPQRSLERALGAPLSLALAARGVLLLHAAALRGRAGVLALSAPSGGGKSSLVAAAANRPPFGLVRVADDQLPARLQAPVAALPHFPQLKLAAADWYPADGPGELPLAALVEIAHEPRDEPPRLERLAPAAACAAFAAATTAARLFDRARQAEHLTACASAARSVPVFSLRYRSGYEGLDEALAALAVLDADLARGAAGADAAARAPRA